MTRPNERARAWAWHTGRATLYTAAALVVLALGATLIWTIAWATTGEGSWLLVAALIAAVIVVIGTASWFQAGKTRP